MATVTQLTQFFWLTQNDLKTVKNTFFCHKYIDLMIKDTHSLHCSFLVQNIML